MGHTIALGYFLVSGYRTGALVVWIGVVSHWMLDFITHRPDMPIYAGGPMVGLGLWNIPAATVLVEGLMYAIAVWIYVGVTRLTMESADGDYGSM